VQRLVIIGGGFGGLWAAMSAAAERHRQDLTPGDLSIELINEGPDLVVRPRLYEGAKPDICVPLRPLLDVIDVDFCQARVSDINPDARTIGLAATAGDAERNYDRLILAAGSRLKKLPLSGWDDYAFSADTFADAARMDEKLAALALLPGRPTIAVVGAGFTGLELVTELRVRLGAEARLLLLDPAAAPGARLGGELAPVLAEAFAAGEIELHAGAVVTALDGGGLTLATGQRLDADMAVFATGLEASPLTTFIGGPRDKAGRLHADAYLRAPDQPDVLLAGDTGRAMTDDIHPTYMCCQHAIQLGRFAGANAVRDMRGQPLQEYRQERYVTCVDLGPAGAVLTTGWDRRVEKTGTAAKTVKQQIMMERIYPPDPAVGRAEIFKATGL